MRTLIIAVACMFSGCLFSQEIDYCRYLKLDAKAYITERDTNIGVSPKILSDQQDGFSRFLKTHSLRFQYLMVRKMFELKNLSEIYPDTSRIDALFCGVISTGTMTARFTALTPKNMTTWTEKRNTFTEDELMTVASKFFYCDEVNEADTSVTAHICVGINGQSETASPGDLILLEAFAFEAIFYYLSKKKEPQFDLDFSSYKRSAVEKYRTEFRDFDSYLLNVRNEVYEKMKADVDLKQKLLKYYRNNRNNFNIEITR